MADGTLLFLKNMTECREGIAPDATLCTVTKAEDTLIFDFSVTDDFLCSKHGGYNDPLYEGDIVEVLITLGEKNRYLEIEVNPDGAQYCVVIENSDGKGDISITKLPAPIFASAVERTDDGWDCEIALPLNELISLGFSEKNCYFNMLRQSFDRDGRLNLYCLFPTLSSSFHVTDAFQKLEI